MLRISDEKLQRLEDEYDEFISENFCITAIEDGEYPTFDEWLEQWLEEQCENQADRMEDYAC